jgi:hypothetical protein
MAGKPYQSKLTPYRQEIADLRKGWPPTPYKEIAAILNDAHPGLNISPNAVWSFVKMRGGGAKKPKYQLPENKPGGTQSPLSTQPASAQPTEESHSKKEHSLHDIPDTDPYAL